MDFNQYFLPLFQGEASLIINKKVEEFKLFDRKNKDALFEELCFCILAANTSARMALDMQNRIGKGFLYLSENELREKLKAFKYRFYNVRPRYIVESRDIVDELPYIVSMDNKEEARDLLVENVYGFGYKEASHFLRNVGVFDFAILDKHILEWLSRYFQVKKNTSRKNYLYNESIFREIAKSVGMEPGVLDLYIWYMETGTVIK
ncbi:hypothetical protein [Thermoplasma volcanium GSS1]|uniref:8-oxoguanine DNA glycosylase/AP lyase n=1 Tax=Thermoplasma volcanium (strain ATCC 51530 / DSM 4299 / JCM 9571 / NBRC 15438 / GSS1) TaxID=273116 RepID=OGG1_THEVO|nr:N-glycosylase/DNA lyase [Thermoplasma volcanium]Q97CP1.1 RecName: Full=8-oxoguanine DNA glycosylase/AP lyase; Includes: RecName: Full=8-oxoguanine DNA glycosylase; Short=8-oxoG DNA glycosylase; Includes: RecName: Full=DNA-(apurinic or apyrimidinic site) lyase; Short=AP lyase [Thermoplasma volcanium GSS1]BAB59202.1 hypothetical protein [Thermoplasma volcanium GSS1]